MRVYQYHKISLVCLLTVSCNLLENKTSHRGESPLTASELENTPECVGLKTEYADLFKTASDKASADGDMLACETDADCTFVDDVSKLGGLSCEQSVNKEWLERFNTQSSDQLDPLEVKAQDLCKQDMATQCKSGQAQCKEKKCVSRDPEPSSSPGTVDQKACEKIEADYAALYNETAAKAGSDSLSCQTKEDCAFKATDSQIPGIRCPTAVNSNWLNRFNELGKAALDNIREQHINALCSQLAGDCGPSKLVCKQNKCDLE